jgi:hypothetical protein
MPSGPSKTTVAVVAFLIPPACREEVLGDLHERFQSPSQYVADALFTITLIILSRIRRTADVEILLLQSFALYMSQSRPGSMMERFYSSHGAYCALPFLPRWPCSA